MALRPTVPPIDPQVQIGTQIWMTTNLNVSRYRNGDPIPQVTNPTEWENLTTGAWCYYDNNPANGLIYGKLYNWYAVNDPRGLAPAGYHVPSDAEWTLLTNYLGGVEFAGGKMKQVGTSLWENPNALATNSSGFAGLPGGLRDGGFFIKGRYGIWISSTQYNSTTAWTFSVGYDVGNVGRGNNHKATGYSVRCVKD